MGNQGQGKLAWTQSDPVGNSSKSEGTLDDWTSGCGMVGWATSHRYKIHCCRKMTNILGRRLASTEALRIESPCHPSCIFGSTRPGDDVPVVSCSCPPWSCVPTLHTLWNIFLFLGMSSSFKNSFVVWVNWYVLRQCLCPSSSFFPCSTKVVKTCPVYMPHQRATSSYLLNIYLMPDAVGIYTFYNTKP